MSTQENTTFLSSSDVLVTIRKATINVSEKVKSTYGPKGRDKLIVIKETGNLIVTNDGATILRNIKFNDPISQLLVRLSQAQDNEVGDGTTGVVLLASQLILNGIKLIERRLHPHQIVRGYKIALDRCIKFTNELSHINEEGLYRAIMTVFNSKVVRHHAALFSGMLVESIQKKPSASLNIHKVPGGSIGDSELIHGVVFRRPFVYAGYEMQPKHFQRPCVLLLDHELEHKHQKEHSRIVIDDVTSYNEFVDAEWRVLLDKLEYIKETGATVVLSGKAIGDVAMQFFARFNIYAVGRVPNSTLHTLSKTLEIPIMSTIRTDISNKTAICDQITERTMGDDRYIIVEGCPTSVTTILLRGGSAEVLDEVERSVEDAERVCRGLFDKEHRFVPAAGALEIALHHKLKKESSNNSFHLQSAIDAYAESLLEIPATLALNANMNLGDIMTAIKSYQYHNLYNNVENNNKQNNDNNDNNQDTSQKMMMWIDVDHCSLKQQIPTHDGMIREAVHVKTAMLRAATEAATSLLPISAMVVHPRNRSETEQATERAEIARQRRIAERQMRKEKNRSRGETVID